MYCTEVTNYVCNRLVAKYNICLYNYTIVHATNWQNITSGMFHNKLVPVCPLHLSHLSSNRLGWPAAVGFHTDLQLPCRVHKGMEVYAFYVPLNFTLKSTTVMIRGVTVVNA